MLVTWLGGGRRRATGSAKLDAGRPGGCRALAVIGDAVWQVTIVDATMIRYYPGDYDAVLAPLPPAERQLIEGTMAGLRFVRNRMSGPVHSEDFIYLPDGLDGSEQLIAAWSWKRQAMPELDTPPPAGSRWEQARHEAYQDFLADRRVIETFSQVTGFLRVAAARVTRAGSVTSRARPVMTTLHPRCPAGSSSSAS